MKNAYIYIMSNKNRTTFYIGVTNNLERRVVEHKTSYNPDSFTTKYNLFDLVYYETIPDMLQAIEREKQLKNWHKERKITLIKTMNPEIKNLAEYWDCYPEPISESHQTLKQVQHHVSRLHYITQDIEDKTHLDLITDACEAGVDWIQLRLKDKSYEEWKEIATAALLICKKYNTKLIINDNVALAKEIGADGVHLGKQDMPTDKAREILGADCIIGGTANTFEDVKMHTASGVNYIGLGPFRYTSTKANLSPILGLDGYQIITNWCKQENIQVPIIAIGGIVAADIESLFNTGVYGVAIASAITHADNKKETVQEFMKQLSYDTLKTN